MSGETKSGGTAIILSFFWTGLGQLYAGRIARGLIMMVFTPIIWGVGWIGGFGSCLGACGAAGGAVREGAAFGAGGGLLAMLAFAWWIWGMIDAKKLCEAFNTGSGATSSTRAALIFFLTGLPSVAHAEECIAHCRTFCTRQCPESPEKAACHAHCATGCQDACREASRFGGSAVIRPADRFLQGAAGPAKDRAAAATGVTIWTLHDDAEECCPSPFRDTLMRLSPTGDVLLSLQKFAVCDSVGSAPRLAIDPRDRSVWVTNSCRYEDASIIHVGNDGKVIEQISERDIHGLAMDPDGSLIIAAGGRLIRVAQGEQRSLPARVYPVVLAVSPRDRSIWMCGMNSVDRLSPEGESLFHSVDLVRWCCSGLGIDPRDGSVWIAERAYPGKPETRNRVWKLDANGQILAEVPFSAPFEPFAVAVDPESGDVWVSRTTDGLEWISSSAKERRTVRGVAASALAVEPETGMVWATGKSGVVKLSRGGERLVTLANPSGSSSFVAVGTATTAKPRSRAERRSSPPDEFSVRRVDGHSNNRVALQDGADTMYPARPVNLTPGTFDSTTRYWTDAAQALLKWCTETGLPGRCRELIPRLKNPLIPGPTDIHCYGMLRVPRDPGDEATLSTWECSRASREASCLRPPCPTPPGLIVKFKLQGGSWIVRNIETATR